MAEINAKDLTAKTSPASTDSMLLFGTTSNEGAKITVDNLADDILGRLATKTFPNQVGGSSAATILAQLATLNSNIGKTSTPRTFTLIESAETYISDFNFVRYSFGNITVFEVKFTMKTAIQSSLQLGGNSAMPLPMYGAYLKFPTYQDGSTASTPTGAIMVGASGNFEIKGAHAKDSTYVCSGAYITTYAN